MKKLLLLFVLTLFAISCSDDADDSFSKEEINSETETETQNAVRLQTNSTFGSILTNVEGKTLYFFGKDAKGTSNCSGGCADAWPIFFAEELTLDAGLEASNFGNITRADGAKQTTYKGWPLYFFTSDTNAGEVKGDNTNNFFVAKPDYSLMVAVAQLIGRDSNGTETNLTSSYESGEEETLYVTDADGNTLYIFIHDKKDKNNFTADDFSNDAAWPIYHTDITELPSILNPDDFGTIDVFGTLQLTYKGWPLYYFGQDQVRGDNFGVGFPIAGVWPIINLDTEVAPEPDPVVITASYSVSNNQATAYVFTGDDLTDANNPDLTFKRGLTYAFNIDTPGHPFLINSVQGTGTSNTYNDGVTNNGAATGTISFTVPANAPDTLFYNCEFHSSMTGTITIID